MPSLIDVQAFEKEVRDEILLEEIRQNKEAVQEEYNPTGLDIHLSYPYSDQFEFETNLEMIDLDEERIDDIRKNNGFIVSDFQPIKKELKAEYGIFSPKFGSTLEDANPFKDRYSCDCKLTTSRIYNGMKCPHCGTRVKFVDDNYGLFGYMVLLKYKIIHPTLYKQLETLIGPQRLINIIDIEDQKDTDGNSINLGKITQHRKGLYRKEKGANEPFYGIGMEEFEKRFDEIIDYYYNIATNKATKKSYYDSLKFENRDKVFTHSIPVYTTHLRPYNNPNGKKKLDLEGTNGIYNMMSRLVTQINYDNLKIFRKKKIKNELLFSLQMKYVELNKEIDAILSGKKGNVRQLAGGRFNFSSRDVIVQNPRLRIDQVSLPYWCLVDILQQQIINVLVKTYNMSPNDAYRKWSEANIAIDDTIVIIIKGLMFANPEGLPVIINRNPSISKGSLLQMFCVEMTFDYCMGLPLQVLPLLAADFDGDVLNVYYIVNRPFFLRAYQILNPRNSMYISNNDGQLNTDVVPNRDALILANSMTRLGRGSYSQEELEMIRRIKNKNM